MRAPQDFHKRCGTFPRIRLCTAALPADYYRHPFAAPVSPTGMERVKTRHILRLVHHHNWVCYARSIHPGALCFIRADIYPFRATEHAKKADNPKLSSPVIPDKTKTPRAPRGPSSECRFMSLFIKMCGCTHCLFMRCQGFILLS